MGLISNSIEFIRAFSKRGDLYPGERATSSRSLSPYGFGGSAGAMTNGYNDWLQQQTQLGTDLLSRYADYESMADYPEIGNCLRILADEATQSDVVEKKSLWATSANAGVQDAINHMLHKTLGVQKDLWNMAYQVSQTGNMFEANLVQEGYGVVKLLNLPVATVRRIEDQYAHLWGYVQDYEGNFDNVSTEQFKQLLAANRAEPSRNGQVVFEPWEVAHFRYRATARSDLYGVSTVEAARWVWVRLKMMEDSMVLFKLTRSPARYAFYVDVGSVPANQRQAELEKIKNNYKKRKFTNPKTGQVEFRYNVMSSDEDFFMSKSGGERLSEVELLSGLDSQGVDDSEYFRQKLFSALPIPKAYLSQDESIGRANLGQQDIRLAKTVLRIQDTLMDGFRQICNTHLAARNIDPDRVDYDLNMVVPSGTLEMIRYEVKRIQVELGQQYAALNFPEEYIWRDILGFSEDEIVSIRAMRDREANQGVTPPEGDASAGSGGAPMASDVPDPAAAADAAVDAATQATDAGIQQISSRIHSMHNQIVETLHRNNRANRASITEIKSLAGDIRSRLQRVSQKNGRSVQRSTKSD
jgi:hypothetical protein